MEFSPVKSLASSTALATLLLSCPSYADPTVMIGLALNFGGGEKPALGLTGKVLSSNKEDEVVGAAGATYFFDGYWGLDAGIGYTFDDSAVTLTYDFLNKRPQISAGWADIESVC
jgi:hypothetical protein